MVGPTKSITDHLHGVVEDASLEVGVKEEVFGPVDPADLLQQLLAGVAVRDALLVQHHLAGVGARLPDDGVAGGRLVGLLLAAVYGGQGRPTQLLATGQEPVVVEGAAGGVHRVTKVVAALLDLTDPLTEGGVRDVLIDIDQLVHLRGAGADGVSLAASQQGGGGQGEGQGGADAQEEADGGQHVLYLVSGVKE